MCARRCLLSILPVLLVPALFGGARARAESPFAVPARFDLRTPPALPAPDEDAAGDRLIVDYHDTGETVVAAEGDPGHGLHLRHGGGGFMMGVMSLHFGHVAPQFPNNVFIFGGGGFGHVTEDIRIGGFGFGGGATEKSHELELSAGALRADYVLRLGDALALSCGLVAGGGTVVFTEDVTRNQDRNRTERVNLLDEGYFFYGVMGSLNLALARWVELRLEAGYLETEILNATNGAAYAGLSFVFGF